MISFEPVSSEEIFNAISHKIMKHKSYRTNWDDLIESFHDSDTQYARVITDEYASISSIQTTLNRAIERHGWGDHMFARIFNSEVYLIKQ